MGPGGARTGPIAFSHPSFARGAAYRLREGAKDFMGTMQCPRAFDVRL